MTTRTLEIKFVGDSSGATRSFADVEAAGGKLEGKLGGLKGAFSGVAQVAGGFVVAEGLMKLPGFLAGAAQAAADDEAATLRLEQSLRNLGGSFDENLAKVNARIEAGQKLAFSDDDVRDSFQFLAAATGDTDEALRRQTAAMDLARGANIPLTQATKMLGKLNEENVEVFKKLGITLGENASEADALAAVQAKFGGQAQEYAKSTAGQFAQAKLALGEIVESIGSALLPVFAKLGTALAEHLPKIQEFVGALGEKAAAVIVPAMEAVLGVMERLGPVIQRVWGEDIAPKVDAAKEVLGQMADAAGRLAETIASKLEGPLKRVIGFVADHKEIWGGVAVAIGVGLVAAFTALAVSAGAAAISVIAATAPFLAIGIAIAAVSAGIIYLVKHWDELTEKYPVLGSISDALTEKFEAFAGWVTGTFIPDVKRLAEIIGEAGAAAVGFVRQHWGTIDGILRPYVEAWKAIFSAWFDAVKVVFEEGLKVVKGVYETFMGVFTGDWARAWNGIKDVFGAIWSGLKELAVIGLGLLKDLIPIALEAGKDILRGLKDGIVWLWDNELLPFITGLPQNIVDGLGALGDILLESGKALAGGFKAGIQAGLGGLMDLVASLVNPVIDAYNNTIGRVTGKIDRIGGGGGSSSSVTGNPVPGGDDDTMTGREVFGQEMGGGGGGGVYTPSGAYGRPLTNVNGQWLDLNAIGSDAGPGAQHRGIVRVTIQGDVYARDHTEQGLAAGDLAFLAGLQQAGVR